MLRSQGRSGPGRRRADQFHLVRSSREQAMSAEARARRDELEQAVSRLRQQKSAMSETDYYAQLEALLLDLARLYCYGGMEAGDQRDLRTGNSPY